MHCLALLENDAGVVGWGKNLYGQLGVGGQKEKEGVFKPMKLK